MLIISLILFSMLPTQVSHWYTIFASLGEDYEPSRQYTLNDFQFYDIYDHSDIIFEICHDAMQQEKLRGKVCCDSIDVL